MNFLNTHALVHPNRKQLFTSLPLSFSFEHRFVQRSKFSDSRASRFSHSNVRDWRSDCLRNFMQHLYFVWLYTSSVYRSSWILPWATEIPFNSWRKPNACICVPRKQTQVIKLVPTAGRWGLFDANRNVSSGSERIFLKIYLQITQHAEEAFGHSTP